MTAFLCSTLRSAAPWRGALPARALRANPFLESLNVATLGSLSTAAVALISAVALAAMGGA